MWNYLAYFGSDMYSYLNNAEFHFAILVTAYFEVA